jgi:manganese/iron transport system ATP-binding protein
MATSIADKTDVHRDGAPSIVVTGVSVQYDGVHALEDITFQLRHGERVAVVGPNGAGKSTLFKVIAGVLRPTQGQVDLFGGQPQEHKCVAYVPQRSQVDNSFPVNVRDVVMMGRVGRLGMLHWPTRRDQQMVQECLEFVKATHLAQRQIGELSGGQQQRVFIAQALAQEAQIMLMDEPLTGLDANSQEDVLQTLNELRRREVTVMVATHDLNQAAQCFDRVILLNHRLVAFGYADEVFTSEFLRQAYGEQLRLVQMADGIMAFSDKSCHSGLEGGHV